MQLPQEVQGSSEAHDIIEQPATADKVEEEPDELTAASEEPDGLTTPSDSPTADSEFKLDVALCSHDI